MKLMDQTARDFSAGEQVGPYVIESLLAKGGMGSVYRAQGPDGDTVALKTVKGDLAADDVFKRRFEREVRLAAEIEHPHVVRVLGSGEHEGTPYLAQAFITGGSLADRIDQGGALPLDDTVRICLEVSDGLDAMHRRGLVHRDVKPGNILLDEAGSSYITDFGLAKDKQGSLLTRPGQAIGSMDYMAPEQIRGEPAEPPADVYALGCVAYECLAGAPPFGDREGMRVMWAHLQEQPVALAERCEGVPERVVAAIAVAMAKEPRDRPQAAGLFAAALKGEERAVEGGST